MSEQTKARLEGIAWAALTGMAAVGLVYNAGGGVDLKAMALGALTGAFLYIRNNVKIQTPAPAFCPKCGTQLP